MNHDIRELIITAMRESHIHETLNNEILRVINSQRMSLEQQLNNVIEQLCVGLLNGQA